MSDEGRTVVSNDEVRATVSKDANPISTKGKPDAVRLRLLGAADLLKEHSPENVVIEVALTGNEPTLANGHKLINANKILSAGTCYEE